MKKSVVFIFALAMFNLVAIILLPTDSFADGHYKVVEPKVKMTDQEVIDHWLRGVPTLQKKRKNFEVVRNLRESKRAAFAAIIHAVQSSDKYLDYENNYTFKIETNYYLLTIGEGLSLEKTGAPAFTPKNAVACYEISDGQPRDLVKMTNTFAAYNQNLNKSSKTGPAALREVAIDFVQKNGNLSAENAVRAINKWAKAGCFATQSSM